MFLLSRIYFPMPHLQLPNSCFKGSRATLGLRLTGQYGNLKGMERSGLAKTSLSEGKT